MHWLNLKSICFCQQQSGAYGPTLGYIILSSPVDAAAIVRYVDDHHLDSLAIAMMTIDYPSNSSPMMNRQNWMDLCRHRRLLSVHQVLVMVPPAVLPMQNLKDKQKERERKKTFDE